MTGDPITAERDLELGKAQEIMLSNGFRHLPVVDAGRVVGIVSLRRVAAAIAHIPLEET